MTRPSGESPIPVRPLTIDEAVVPSIWIVDDSPLQGEISRQILARRHKVVMFDRAAPMLERLATGERPDLIILDWHMPEVSGLEACRFARTVADGAELPIIVLTATGDQQDLLDGLGAGANDFVRKPVDEDEINARVGVLVRTKRLHARLAATEAALRAEASFRERFLAILAHDLRQPLNIFTLGSEALAASDTPQEVRERLKLVFAGATGRMERMIRDLLDFSRSRPQGGGMPIVLESIDLAIVVRDVVEQVRLEHSMRTITLDVQVSAPGSWDADRLAQVIGNLVENALAHGTPGSAVRVALTAGPGGAEVTVENEGPPIAPDLVTMLFDPFRRGATRARGDRGLGLGLYIVDQVVKAHGGTVKVFSGEGLVRFSIALPMAPATTVAMAASATVAPLILVVDDDDDARTVRMASLEHGGFRVDQAANGIEALERISKSPPDLIFMDLAMPRMDGWEATRLIKSDPLTRGIAVIVLTGLSAPDALDRARAAGAAHVAQTPCSAEEMLAIIHRHLEAPAAA